MRHFPRITLAIIIIVIFISSLSFAWTRPKWLVGGSVTHPHAAASGSNIFMVDWSVIANFDFLKSTDNGYSWSNPIQPADTFYGVSSLADVGYTPNGLIHVVWTGDYQNDPYAYIFHQSSSDGGRHWSDRHRVFNSHNLSSDFPKLASKGDTLFLACNLFPYIATFRSFNSGLTWRDSTIVDTFDVMPQPPVLLYSLGKLHLIYEGGNSDVGLQIYYSHSDDLGRTWSPPIYLSDAQPPYYDSQCPAASADASGHIAVFWFDYKYGSMCGTTGDILGRVSTDNGDTWLPETRLTYTQSGESPSCLITGDTIEVVWPDYWPFDCNHAKIEISYSGNWGVDWSEPRTIIDREQRDEHEPFLCSTTDHVGTYIHCFCDMNFYPSGSGIYYIRNKYFYSDRMRLPDPQPIFLSIKAYPNVFNSSTMISIDNEEGGDVEIEIFNILGQRIWTKSLNGKEGTIIWDAKDMNGDGVSSGTYFIRAMSQNNSSVIKLIYLK